MRPSWSFVPACLLAIVLLAESFRPNYARFLFADRERIGKLLAASPDAQAPGYRACLDRAAELMPKGRSVAIVGPWRSWDPGYAYAYYRASYLLPGRRVVPLLDPADVPHPERLRESDWVVAWHAPLPEASLASVDRRGDCLVGRLR